MIRWPPDAGACARIPWQVTALTITVRAHSKSGRATALAVQLTYQRLGPRVQSMDLMVMPIGTSAAVTDSAEDAGFGASAPETIGR